MTIALATVFCNFPRVHCNADEVARESRSAVEQGEKTENERPIRRYIPSGINRAIPLLRLKEVREAIELTPKQEKALRDSARQNAEPKDSPTVNDHDDQTATGADTTRERRAQWAKTAREHLEEILHPEQLERLYEISLQLRGLSVLQDRDVMKELKITADQRHEIVNRQISFLRRLSETDLKKADQLAMKTLRDEMNATVLNVLDEEQTKKLSEMKGEKFEIPQRWHAQGVMMQELQTQPAFPFERTANRTGITQRKLKDVTVQQRRGQQPREREPNIE
ncbi:hypothetical protein Enr13x_21330 [Stieleria neptunia]|uniref:LTXXQ motif protein n=2 Tax=Stieleria neptunia TaxID=2527979 RepID=A0A518HN59_9BACT|nr:hypothetical protein Enr13x_21330 [Stieleria neptunia]